MRSPRNTVLRTLSALAPLALLSTANAQTLYTAGLDSFFSKADPNAGVFQPLGACGGSVQSMIESYQDLYLGDVGGRVYKHFGHPSGPFPGNTTYLFDSPNDATALADYGGALLVGGSDSTVHMINKISGVVEETFNTLSPVGAMVRVGDTLFVGSGTTQVVKINLRTGAQNIFGVCGGEIRSMAEDGTHLFLGTSFSGATQGVVYTMLMSSGIVDGAFMVANDANGMARLGNDLFVGGSDRSILRVDSSTGAVVDTLTSNGFDVSALAMSPVVEEPGVPYCFGLGCPCGNDDPLSGCANSTQVGASMRGTGSSSFLADDLVVTVDQLPPNKFAVNYMGILTNDIPFGDGKLCTGGGYPIFRFPIQNSGSSGTIALGPGIVAHSQANFGALGQISPSSTWLFQIWYRNPTGPCTSGFNTSNGYTVTFTP
jgi:hypothetical protein